MRVGQFGSAKGGQLDPARTEFYIGTRVVNLDRQRLDICCGFSIVDAITGATKSSHGTRTCTWNAKDFNQALVADGNYKIWMELTDKNCTGNYSSFTFAKGLEAENLTPSTVPSIANISILWEPVLTAVSENISEKNYHVYPNPTTGVFQVSGENILEVVVLNSAGIEVLKGRTTTVDLTGKANGIYYIRIMTIRGSVMKKIFFNGR